CRLADTKRRSPDILFVTSWKTILEEGKVDNTQCPVHHPRYTGEKRLLQTQNHRSVRDERRALCLGAQECLDVVGSLRAARFEFSSQYLACKPWARRYCTIFNCG